MIFAQHGPSWKPKLDRFYANRLIDGVIWDPREETINRIKDVREDNTDYSLGKNIVDLKVYYKQFSGSIPKKLNDLSYFPEQDIDRAFLRNTSNIENLVESSIDFQLDFNVDALMAPSLYLYSFNDRIVDKLFDIWEIFNESVSNRGIEAEKYVSVIFSESALENKSYIADFLDDFSDISHNFDGIYITIDRENNNKHRHDFNPTRLQNMLQFIYDLKNLGLKVIIGYVGIESILYFAVGAEAIGTGWFYSLRNFNKEQKGLEPVEGMGRQKKRYTSMKMLFELAIEDEIFSIPEEYQDEMYGKILCDCELDDKINSGNIESINLNEIYQQYFEALKKVVEGIVEKESIDEKLRLVNEIVDTAESNINRYNELNPLQRINGRHIGNYKNALNGFQEDNFIIL
ncbi:hypothetical protein [Bacillus wiedmannii]|uniref:Uncharacterized protein n=1 Tax=Bacillus wiedmannii TaxID=1890302 RepID=A0ABX5DRL7_9BACI|nr:hypothetical protein [Bacillus wiedmannii]PRT39169.1 hypothetical protein C6357_19695 [Bacillus wiedmannii]